MGMKIALITGITGQDGSYLTELLLDKSYIIYGIIRRSSDINTKRIDHLYNNPNLHLRYGDLTDSCNIINIINDIKNNHQNLDRLEIYNLAAMSHVKVSFDMPEYTANTDGIGVLRILEAIRFSGLQDKVRFYQASTSELYGLVQEVPQRESTPFYPRSPYGVAKLYGYWITKNYRESYNMFACNGILFNHEGPRRGPTFVTRKITRCVALIQAGQQEVLSLGNIDAKRDWGHAKDYVEGMWKMLQVNEPKDYVLSTNEFHSVREFVELAFKEAGFTITWHGEKGTVDEVGKDQEGKVRVKIDPQYFLPC